MLEGIEPDQRRIYVEGWMKPDSRARILVVEDEEALRGLVVRSLQGAGYEAVAVNDGLAALDACKTANTPYDLVITNNRMPHLSGEEVIAQLRVACPGLPIIHIDDRSTSFTLPNDVPNLSKPFPLETLLELVDTELRRSGWWAERHAEA
jgi:DNA-binding response OmpR family regulator